MGRRIRPVTNNDLSQDYLEQAEVRAEFIGIALERKVWSVVIRVSQEVTELCLKAALRLAGVEPPQWHDVGDILEREKGRFPDWFQNEITFLKTVSLELRQARELSLYGDAESETPAGKLFSEDDALTAKQKAEKVLRLCRQLIVK